MHFETSYSIASCSPGSTYSRVRSSRVCERFFKGILIFLGTA